MYKITRSMNGDVYVTISVETLADAKKRYRNECKDIAEGETISLYSVTYKYALESVDYERYQLEQLKKQIKKVLKKYAESHDFSTGMYMNSQQMKKRTATYEMGFYNLDALRKYHAGELSCAEVVKECKQHANDPALMEALKNVGVKGFRLEEAESHFLPVMRIFY